jgi:TolB-like protein/DNA-binding winged helix-turn-helix (wHTH) protein
LDLCCAEVQLDVSTKTQGVFFFEHFRLDPVSGTLARNGVPIKLPARLFDTLCCLVRNGGDLVERGRLEQAVWPGRVVDDGNVGRAVSSLRAALKEHGAPESLIVTVAGRGYRLGAIVTLQTAAGPTIEPPGALAPADPTPAPAPAEPAKPPATDAAASLASRRSWRGAAMIAVALLALVWLGWRFGVSGPHGGAATGFAPPPASVAVIPFANMSEDPHQTYLADGIADELINALGRIGGVQVAARPSSFRFKGSDVAVGDIARQLNVGAVLEGSVRRDGGRLRITAQLIDATTGYQTWSHSYDRDPGDMLALEGEIADAVITSLRIVLLPQDSARLTRGGTSNPRAFDAFLSGTTLSQDPGLPARRKALADFDTAITLDPNYAMAFVYRSNLQATMGAGGEMKDVAESRRLLSAAQADAEHAIALAPDLGEAHAALAFVLRNNLSSLARSSTEYDRAFALAPGNARILRSYAFFELAIGHISKAIEVARRSAALDPLTPRTYRYLARILGFGGQYQEALAALHRAQLLLPPDPAADRVALGDLEMYSGHPETARQSCEGRHDFFANYCLAWAYHVLGRPADARAQLDMLRAKLGDNGAVQYAAIYAVWGDRPQAVEWLKTAYQLRDPGLEQIRFEPWLKLLKDTPEYQDIERQMDFPS